MVLRNGKYVSLKHTNAVSSVIPATNRLRRIERCELECGSNLEIHCLRFDILLGCAAYLDFPIIQQHLTTVHKTYGYMIRSK